MSTAHNVITGRSSKNNDDARELFNTLVRAWNLPTKESKDGELGDLSRARRMAQDPEAVEEAYGHRHAFLAAAIAGEGYERGQDAAVDALLERAAGERSASPDGERAAIDKSVVEAATPIEVDPQIVDIQSNAAPLLDIITMEAQAGFTAQYNIINGRNPPVGRVDESDAIDLTDNDDGDFSLGTETEPMKIYVDRVTLSDFTQRAEDSLGYMDVEETTLGQRTVVYSQYMAGEAVYGDPRVGKSDGSIQDSNAAPGLAAIADTIKAFRRIIAHWRDTLPDRFTEIRYEDLVSDPDTQSRALISAAGLDWEDQCLSFHENPGTVKTLSLHQVRQPIYQSSAAAWRRYESALQPFFDAWGDTPWD